MSFGPAAIVIYTRSIRTRRRTRNSGSLYSEETGVIVLGNYILGAFRPGAHIRWAHIHDFKVCCRQRRKIN